MGPYYADSYGGLQSAIMADRQSREARYMAAIQQQQQQAAATREYQFRQQQYADQMAQQAYVNQVNQAQEAARRRDALITMQRQAEQDRFAREKFDYDKQRQDAYDRAYQAQQAQPPKEVVNMDLKSAQADAETGMFGHPDEVARKYPSLSKVPGVTESLAQKSLSVRPSFQEQYTTGVQNADIANQSRRLMRDASGIAADPNYTGLDRFTQSGWGRLSRWLVGNSVPQPDTDSSEMMRRGQEIWGRVKPLTEGKYPEMESDPRTGQYRTLVPSYDWMTNAPVHRAVTPVSGKVNITLSDGRSIYATPEAAKQVLARDPNAVIVGNGNSFTNLPPVNGANLRRYGLMLQ